jgi:hypothetical protein
MWPVAGSTLLITNKVGATEVKLLKFIKLKVNSMKGAFKISD